MRIAYISFEHPLGIAGGGIGTYVAQISTLMAARGHSVEVFSGTFGKTWSATVINGYQLTLIPAENTLAFRSLVLPFFTERHTALPFDLIESPEFGADALEIKKALPALPLTVKLHTPTLLMARLNELKDSLTDKLRFMVGGLIRLKKVKPYWAYDKNQDAEYELFKLADSISSPSRSLAKIVADEWKSDKEIAVIPYPFQPADDSFKPVMIKPGSSIIITFIGKLEKRKGILDLMAAIPAILKIFPSAQFRFVGAASPSPVAGMDMIAYLKKKLFKYSNSLAFLGFAPYHKIPSIINESHICVFPSLWENFPNVCLETMLGGRSVIGTNNGGMADMITDQVNGLLIPPGSPRAIADAVVTLCKNPELIHTIGIAARASILERYKGDVIGKQTEDFYLKTINANA